MIDEKKMIEALKEQFYEFLDLYNPNNIQNKLKGTNLAYINN